MCFYTRQTKSAVEVEKRFNAKIADPDAFGTYEFLSGFTFPKTAVITGDVPDAIQHFHWGLIPEWSADESIRSHTLNARIETLSVKPAFRDYEQNRCLVIANGFYEWKWLDTRGKLKQKFQIGLPDDALFAFAGIWSKWIDHTGHPRATYSIVTTRANTLMSEIHNTKKRMPVILTPENELAWLSGADKDLFKAPEINLRALPTDDNPPFTQQLRLF